MLSAYAACDKRHIWNDFNLLRVTAPSHGIGISGVETSSFSRRATRMGVRRPAPVDDGYQSGTLAEGRVWELRGPRTGFSTGAAPGMFGVSRTGLYPKRAKGLAKPMARTLQKNIRVTPEQWGRIENVAAERDVSANRIVVDLAMEALDRREWPRTEAETQVARASLFAAQVLARDLILSGREQEVSEIRDFISAVVPNGHTGKPVRGRSNDQAGAAELIRDRMPATLGSEPRAQAPTMPTGLTSLIERTFLHAYFLATLKRDEMIGEGRNAEVDSMVQQARKAQAQMLKATGN